MFGKISRKTGEGKTVGGNFQIRKEEKLNRYGTLSNSSHKFQNVTQQFFFQGWRSGRGKGREEKTFPENKKGEEPKLGANERTIPFIS